MSQKEADDQACPEFHHSFDRQYLFILNSREDRSVSPGPLHLFDNMVKSKRILTSTLKMDILRAAFLCLCDICVVRDRHIDIFFSALSE